MTLFGLFSQFFTIYCNNFQLQPWNCQCKVSHVQAIARADFFKHYHNFYFHLSVRKHHHRLDLKKQIWKRLGWRMGSKCDTNNRALDLLRWYVHSGSHHRLAVVDRHPFLLHHVAWDGNRGQIQALRGELRDYGTPVWNRWFLHCRERRIHIREAQTRLRLRWRCDGRNLKLLISQARCMKSLKRRRRKKEDESHEIKQYQTAFAKVGLI